MKMKPLCAAEVRFLVNSPYILALQLMPQPHRNFLNIFNLLTMTIFSCIFSILRRTIAVVEMGEYLMVSQKAHFCIDIAQLTKTIANIRHYFLSCFPSKLLSKKIKIKTKKVSSHYPD